MKYNLFHAAVLAAALTASTRPAGAQTTAWGLPQSISADSDVLTNGSLVAAWAMGNNNTNGIPLNGVSFVSWKGNGKNTGSVAPDGVSTLSCGVGDSITPNGTAFGATTTPFDQLSTNYIALLSSANYNNGTPMVLTVGGLTAGQMYQAEIWVNDSRSCCGGRTELVDGQSDLLFDTSGAITGGEGTFAVGNFIASGTNQAITLAPSASAQIAMFELRAVSSAVPPVAGVPVISPSTIYIGTPVVLNESAASAGATTYQWQTDNGTGTFSNIGPASTNGTLVLNTLNFTNGTTYYFQVVVSNSLGATTSPSSILTLAPAQVPTPTKFLTATPSNSVFYAGQQVALSAAFTGTLPISYQWLDGSTPVPGATNATLTLTNLQSAAAGSYSLSATNIIGATNLGPFAFTVGSAPPAGGILWGTPGTITGDTNVANQGVTLVAYAANSGLTPANGTVNGVTFETFGASGTSFTNGNVVLANSAGISLYTGFNDGGTYAPFDTLSTNLQSILSGGNYGNTAADPGEQPYYLTFNGLSPGTTYEFEYFAQDARTCCGGRYTTLTDPTGEAAAIPSYGSAANLNGGAGSYVTGTFTTSPTNPTSETIVIQGFQGTTTSGSSQINAFQLRAVSAAFPAFFETPVTFSPGGDVYSGTIVSLAASAVGPTNTTLSYQWQTDGGSGGAFTNVGPAGSSPTLTVNTTGIASGSAVFAYRIVATGDGFSSTSAVSSLTVNANVAGAINWGASTPISGDSDVDTNGVTATALTASTSALALSGGLTVNGVTFTSFDSPSAGGSSGNVSLVSSAGISFYNGYNNGGTTPPFSNLSTNYQTVLASGNYGNVDTWTLTFGGLSAGVQYELEFWVNDSRTCCETRHETLTDPNNVSADLGPYNVQSEAGGMGSYIKGTFTAAGPSEAVTVYGYSASTELQAYQLRILSTNFPPYVNPPAFSPSATVYSGTPVIAKAAAVGPANAALTYQFQTDGGSGGALTNLGSATTNASLTVGTAGVTNSTVYNYQVIVTGAGFSSTSSVSSLTVNPGSIAIIDTEPGSVTNYQGTTANFTVVAEGTAPLKYQWQASASPNGPFTNLVAGGAIPSVTNATLSIVGLSSNSPANLQVTVSNPLGVVTSSPPSSLAVALLPAPGTGGTINWGPSVGSQGDSDVVNTGFPVAALTASSTPVLVNSVNFSPFVDTTTPSLTLGNVTLTSSATLNNYTGFNDGGTFAPFNQLSANYQALLSSGEWDDSGVWTLVVTNLIPGTNYLIQYWVQDARTCCGTRNEAITDVNNNQVVVGPYNNEGNIDGGIGSYIIGEFIQNSSGTLTLTINNGGSTPVPGYGSTQFNAFQIRELGLAAPPPVVTMNITTSTNNLLTITWPAGSLLQSTNILGPWKTNTATSPYTFSKTNAAIEFYQIRVK